MYVAKCEIKIVSKAGKIFRLTRATSVEINKSTHFLTDTATIRLPTTAVMKDCRSVTTVEIVREIVAGMEIYIKLWYKGFEKQAVEFAGYVRKVNRKTPIEIECENLLGTLRYRNLNKDWKETTLEQVLREIVKETPVRLTGNIPPMTLKGFYLKNVSALEALQKIRDEFGLSVYMDTGETLYCGLAYGENRGLAKYYLYGTKANVIQTDNLLWQNDDDVRLCVKAIAVKPDNECLVGVVGDEGGAVRVLRFYNIDTKEELEAMARQELMKYKFEGYRGKITGFLVPGVCPGMIAEIADEKYPQRGGKYFVESVRTKFGISGCRNEVELGMRIE